MIKEIELKLIGSRTRDGEIAAKDLAALASAIQELTIRISREVMGAAGPGRTRQFMEEFAQIRLRAIDAGSTVLLFSKGPADKLDVDLAVQGVADDRLWEMITAIGLDRRPEWVTELIADSAGRLVSALQVAAPEIRLRSPSRADVMIDSSRIHVETWHGRRVQTSTESTATGLLEKVDLRFHEFRVRDDIGQAVDLKHVRDDVGAARLVGKWVLARGLATLRDGQLVALEGAQIEEIEDPAAGYFDGSGQTLTDILASAPGPGLDMGLDLTDEEFEEFLKAARS